MNYFNDEQDFLLKDLLSSMVVKKPQLHVEAHVLVEEKIKIINILQAQLARMQVLMKKEGSWICQS